MEPYIVKVKQEKFPAFCLLELSKLEIKTNLILWLLLCQ